MANINIGGRLHSTATGNTVAGANEILDDSKGKKQSVINQETDAALAGKQATIEDLSTIRSGAAAGATAYQKPGTGIPSTDMASGVQTSLGKADTAYQKPGAGVPKTDLESGVQASLDLADSAIQARPMGAIDPTITPADYATKEELDELEAKVDEIDEAFEKSPNLLNLDTITEGIKFSSSTGQPSADDTQNGTDYIKVTAGTTYECQSRQGNTTSTRQVRWYAYDEDKTFISGSFLSANTYTVPVNGAYVRVAYPNSDIYTEWMIAAGSVVTTFVEYYDRVKASHLPMDGAYDVNSNNPVKNKVLAGTILNGNGYGDFSIPASALSIMTAGLNKLNLADKDFVYGKNITASGTTDNANAFSSGYIPAIPGRRYAFYAAISETHLPARFGCRWNAYDENKTPIADAYNSDSAFIDVPEGAKYIRMGFVYNGTPAVPYYWMVVEDRGLSAIDYEAYKLILAEERLPDDAIRIWRNKLAIPEIKAFAGQPINIYYGNIVDYFKDDVYFTPKISKGDLTKKKWTYTPNGAETFTVPFIFLDHSFRELNNDEVSVKVVASSVKASLKVLVIGDSTVNLATSLLGGGETQKMLDLASADNYPLTLLGTRGVGLNQHEGRGGWTAKMYCTQASSGTTQNAFWNPITSEFDFSYYMTEQGYSGVDCVFIQLGINDMTSYNSNRIIDDATAETAIAEFFTCMDEMIESIHAYDASINVVVNLTIPCTDDQDKYLNTRQPWWRFKRNTYLLNVASLTHYANMANVFVSWFNAALDIDKLSDAVHPTQEGFDELGTQMYSFMRAIN